MPDLKSPDLHFDINFDLASCAVQVLVFNLPVSFATLFFFRDRFIKF